MADCGLGQEQQEEDFEEEEDDEDDVEDFDKPLEEEEDEDDVEDFDDDEDDDDDDEDDVEDFDKLLEQEEEDEDDVEDSDDFPANFKEYMERELNYFRLEICNKPPGYKPGRAMIYWKEIRWIFWNRQNDPTLSYDHSVDFFPDVRASKEVRLNIRRALHKLMLYPELCGSVVQFWAPTKTKEGRTLLSTQFQPFAVGTIEHRIGELHYLCKYRMGMCREYNNFFYADAECAEEQLGVPGRVFLNKLPEYTGYVKHCTLEEYPQRDLALRCDIEASWALPVFEHSSHTCVGVLEIARGVSNSCLLDEEFLGRMYDIFQEFDLRCFDGYKHCKMQYEDESGGKNEARMAAFQELEMVYESVHKIHNLRMILTWVSCRSCNDLLHSQFQLLSRDYGGKFNCFSPKLLDFMRVCERSLLKKGQVTGRILPFPNLLYCSDVKQFSIAEFPLVPHARHCKLGGWFTMCLQSSYTGDELYVLEFFLSESDENGENILTKLRLILGTMEEYFKTFKLASGQGLGEELSVEVIDFQYGKRSQTIQMIPATRFIPSLELLQDGGVMLQQAQQDQPSMDAINNGMYVVSEAQNDNLPSLDSLQNGKVMTQVDSSNQPSMDASSNGQNVVAAKRNIFVVSSSKEPERKMQDRKHKKGGPRIDIPKKKILKCSHMNRKDAAGKLRVGISTFKRVCRGHGIDRWPPRNIEKIQSSLPSSVENQGQIPQLNFDFPSNQASGTQDRKHKKGGPRIDIPKEKILKCSHMNQEDAARKLIIGISTFKRVCRGHGIDRWPPRNIEKIQPSLPSSVENHGQTPQLNFDFPSNQASGTIANIKTGFQDADTVTIRAKCETNTIKFRLSLSSKLEELQQQVAKRLNLKAGTYRIKYKDEKDELILIACDEDLQYCMQSLGNNDIYITLELLNSS